MNKYTVTPINESSVYVHAERMELLEKAVTLFVGGEIKAHFPHVESVVVDFAPKPDPCPPTASPAAFTAEAAVVDFPPSVSIGSIHIEARSINHVLAALASAMAGARSEVRL